MTIVPTSDMASHLIVGGLSQDGRLLADLLPSSDRVILTSRSYSAHTVTNKNSEVVKLNPLNGLEVVSLLHSLRPTYVYHLSAQSSVGLSFRNPQDTFDSNLISFLNLLESIVHTGQRPTVFFPASTDMYGNIPSCRINESTPCLPVSPYGISKHSALQLARMYSSRYSIPILSGILSNHESPYRSPYFVTHKLIRTAYQAKQDPRTRVAFGNLDIIRDWGWAAQYMQIVSELLMSGTTGEFLIATGRSVSLRYLAEYAFSQLGLDYRDHITEDPGLVRPTEINSIYCDNSKLLNHLPGTSLHTAEFVIEQLLHHYTPT